MTITEPTILKRIKRHVVGRNRRYFIVSPPGFENLCLKELLSFPLTAHNASVIPGGVEFVGRLHDCYLANLYLRTANRILMRICQIKAANFKELEKRASEVPWELFLQP
ncbi:MAG: THUMP domain-containing protein, partial [Desulfobacterales bacterium]